MTIPIGAGSLALPPELSAIARPLTGGGANVGMPTGLGQTGVTGDGRGTVGGATGAGTDFGDRVSDFLGDVTRLDGRAQATAEGYMRGEHDDVHGTLIAMQEADVALRFASNVRNRVIEAYREVMRMGA
jgi:flagellar hook-basal body complex protein FliE